MKRSYIGSRVWLPHLPFWYVQFVPGECAFGPAADWGYTDNPAKARKLGVYWSRRFAADMRRVGAKYALREV